LVDGDAGHLGENFLKSNWELNAELRRRSFWEAASVNHHDGMMRASTYTPTHSCSVACLALAAPRALTSGLET
jgi:hypothetical protein